MLTTNSIKSFTDLRHNPAALTKQASDDGPVYILNRNQPVSVLVDVNEFESMLEQLADNRDSLWLKDNEARLKNSPSITAQDLKTKYNLHS